VVDDEKFFRTLVSDFLRENLGLEPAAAESGEEALRLIRSEPVEAVILDIYMPGLDGLAVVREIRRTHPDLPVLIMTSSGSLEDAITALKEGANDYFQKPLDMEAVSESLIRWIEKYHLAMETRRLLVQAGVPAQGTQCTGLETGLEPAESSERRQSPRFPVQEVVRGRMQPLMDFTVVDVSLTGALIEHARALTPGQIVELTVYLNRRELSLRARAARAFASRVLQTDRGRRIIYRTGLEFLEPTPAQQASIAGFIEGLGGQAPRAPGFLRPASS
jgi:CheY-like chemotaxis protein